MNNISWVMLYNRAPKIASHIGFYDSISKTGTTSNIHVGVIDGIPDSPFYLSSSVGTDSPSPLHLCSTVTMSVVG